MATFKSSAFKNKNEAKQHLEKMDLDFWYQNQNGGQKNGASSWKINEENEIEGTSNYFVESTLEAMFNLDPNAVI